MKHPYEEIVQSALTEPGKVHERYAAFHNYSISNQWLAMSQLGKAEPINTFPGWKALERHVKRGAKAIELLMPVFKKAAKEATEEKTEGSMFFIARKNCFGFSQTEGKDYVPVTPGFDITKAVIGLGITEELFECMNGNCMGYAKPDQNIIAVSPIAYDRLKTAAHEIGHVKLHAGMVSMHAPDALPKDVREIEAELVAYLTKAALGKTEGLEYSRGYIQNWISDSTLEKVRFERSLRQPMQS